ncbi:hypothetical protein AHAS_Ahas11G0177500 [Arachis hypogaea]
MAPQRTTTKACLTPKVKPPSKRVKRVIKIDEQEKGNPAKDSARFTNRFCELMFPILEANLSWVVEFYSNYHSPSLQSIFVRRKQVPISEEAIQWILKVLPVPDRTDGYQEVLLQLQRSGFDFDWGSILRVIAQPGEHWTPRRAKAWPKCIEAHVLTVEARV